MMALDRSVRTNVILFSLFLKVAIGVRYRYFKISRYRRRYHSRPLLSDIVLKYRDLRFQVSLLVPYDDRVSQTASNAYSARLLVGNNYIRDFYTSGISIRPFESHSGARETIVVGPYHNLIPLRNEVVIEP